MRAQFDLVGYAGRMTPPGVLDGYYRTFRNRQYWWNGAAWLLLPQDPYWSSVICLARLDTPGITNLGSLGGVGRFTGTTSTTYRRWSNLSVSVNRGSSQYLHFSNSGFALGTGDFTIEFSINPGELGFSKNILDMRSSGAALSPLIGQLSTKEITYYSGTTLRITGTTSDTALNTWTDVAVSRVSGTTRLFVNGTKVGVDYTDGNNYVGNSFAVGNGNIPMSIGDSGPTARFGDVRITKGVGRYTSSYTVSPLPWAAY